MYPILEVQYSKKLYFIYIYINIYMHTRFNFILKHFILGNNKNLETY